MNINRALKNPNVYYIAVPVAAAVWALLAGFAFYPNAIEGWKGSERDFEQSKNLIEQLIKLQPERLDYEVDASGGDQEFDFTRTINEFAKTFSIPPGDYKLNVRGQTKRAGRVTKSASISIKSIDIEKLTQFLSALLLRWPDLKCENLGLELKKNAKNAWQADLSLTYYY